MEPECLHKSIKKSEVFLFRFWLHFGRLFGALWGSKWYQKSIEIRGVFLEVQKWLLEPPLEAKWVPKGWRREGSHGFGRNARSPWWALIERIRVIFGTWSTHAAYPSGGGGFNRSAHSARLGLIRLCMVGELCRVISTSQISDIILFDRTLQISNFTSEISNR